MKRIGEINQDQSLNSLTVDSKERNIKTVDSKTVTTVNSSTVNGFTEELAALIEKYSYKEDGEAILLSELLDDKDSIGYYRLLIEKHGSGQLLIDAYYVRDKAREKKIRTKPAIYFQAILRKKGMQTKFRKD